MPVPIWLSEPVPEISVVVLSLSEWSNANVPLSTMRDVPLIVLLMPPLPSCSVPTEIVRRAGIGVVGSEDRNARAGLDKLAATGNLRRCRLGVGVVERQRAVVEDTRMCC